MTKYIEIDDAQFTRDWVSYIYIRIMAEKYGISGATVVNHAKRLGLSPRVGPNRKKLNDHRAD